jgi:phosphoesterase RecJ-like protein
LGSMERIVREVSDRVLCIDHHPSRDAPWRYTILDVEASATTAMIYELTRECGWTPDRSAAEALYLGLATDTGFFRFNSTNARSHRVAADLIDLGVEPASTYRAVYERNSVEFTRLLGHALSDLRIAAGGSLASVAITGSTIASLGADGVDTAEITTFLLAIDGVRIVALYRELRDGRVKVSLRSKGDLDVHRLAGEFGGGGHRNASGIVLDGPLERVVELVNDRATRLVAASAVD